MFCSLVINLSDYQQCSRPQALTSHSFQDLLEISFYLLDFYCHPRIVQTQTTTRPRWHFHRIYVSAAKESKNLLVDLRQIEKEMAQVETKLQTDRLSGERL